MNFFGVLNFAEVTELRRGVDVQTSTMCSEMKLLYNAGFPSYEKITRASHGAGGLGF